MSRRRSFWRSVNEETSLFTGVLRFLFWDF